MSSSVAEIAKPASASKRRFRLRLAIILIGTLVVAGILFAAVRFLGRVQGEEFSPANFRQRQFSFYEIPVLHLQITPIHRRGSTTPLARYLRQHSLISKSQGEDLGWHLIWLRRGSSARSYKDANLLVDQFRLRMATDLYWQQWSQDHPKQAAVLWPLTQELAQRELYVLLPRLLEIAQHQDDADALKWSIDQYLRTEYRLLIQDMRDAGRDQLAAELLAEALEDYPNDQDLLELDAAR